MNSIALITGATGAIGQAIACQIAARQDYEVVLLCRNPHKAERAVSEIQRRTGNGKVSFEWVDLSRLDRPFAMEVGGDGTWRQIDNPVGPPETGFMLWWEGGRPDATAAHAPDAEVLDQLQALGYLE